MAFPSLLDVHPSANSVLLIAPPCRCDDCEAEALGIEIELRAATSPHDFEVADLAIVNEWNALAAAAELADLADAEAEDLARRLEREQAERDYCDWLDAIEADRPLGWHEDEVRQAGQTARVIGGGR